VFFMSGHVSAVVVMSWHVSGHVYVRTYIRTHVRGYFVLHVHVFFLYHLRKLTTLVMLKKHLLMVPNFTSHNFSAVVVYWWQEEEAKGLYLLSIENFACLIDWIPDSIFCVCIQNQVSAPKQNKKQKTDASTSGAREKDVSLM
jgi:hypothetical protein